MAGNTASYAAKKTLQSPTARGMAMGVGTRMLEKEIENNPQLKEVKNTALKAKEDAQKTKEQVEQGVQKITAAAVDFLSKMRQPQAQQPQR